MNDYPFCKLAYDVKTKSIIRMKISPDIFCIDILVNVTRYLIQWEKNFSLDLLVGTTCSPSGIASCVNEQLHVVYQCVH